MTKKSLNLPLIIFVGILFISTGEIALAFQTDYADAKGETSFSPSFAADYETAIRQTDEEQSMEPLLALVKKYSKPEEQAELQLTIGQFYNQHTGLVDHAKAVEYLTKALDYNLPEKAYVQVLMWRGNSQEQLKKNTEALKDYLRGLIVCIQYDLLHWPEIQEPNETIYLNSTDDLNFSGGPENMERVRDYNRYRKDVDRQRNLLTMRYYFVEAIKRNQQALSLEEHSLEEMIKTLTPEPLQVKKITGLLQAANPQPWP